MSPVSGVSQLGRAAVDHLVALLRLDTSNDGSDDGPGERSAAEYCARVLSDAGLVTEIYEPRSRRSSVVARWKGSDSSRPPLLVHGHLDTVPVEASEWSVDPLGGEVRDDCVWGRGAVDMKDMLAMLLALVHERARQRRAPARDVVIAFMADEEAGGYHGSRWLVDRHRDLFADCTEAISEVGGYSVTGPSGRRAYMLETSCKGVAYVEVTGSADPGHGSLRHSQTSVEVLVAALSRVYAEQWPASREVLDQLTLTGLSELVGRRLTADDIPDALRGTPLEHVASMVEASMRHTANPTVLRAGGLPNVVPSTATAVLDGRFLPGRQEAFLRRIGEVLGESVTHRVLDLAPSFDSPTTGRLVEAMAGSLSALDPGALLVPFRSPASTDNVAFAPLGISTYGFVPLQLPADFQFARMYHGVDERIPSPVSTSASKPSTGSSTCADSRKTTRPPGAVRSAVVRRGGTDAVAGLRRPLGPRQPVPIKEIQG